MISVRSAGEVLELAERRREVVVLWRDDLLAQLLQLDLEPGRLAREARLGIVVREGDVEARRLARLEPDDVGLEARDQPLLAEDQRHPVGRAAVERHAVARARVADDGEVAVPGAAVDHRPEAGVLVAQLVDDLLDLGVVDLLDLGLEVEAAVVAEGDLRPHLHVGREDDGLALLALLDVHLGLGQRQDLLLEHRVAVGALDEVIHRLLDHGFLAEDGLEDAARRLARVGSRGSGCAARGGGRPR